MGRTATFLPGDERAQRTDTGFTMFHLRLPMNILTPKTDSLESTYTKNDHGPWLIVAIVRVFKPSQS